MVSASQPQQVVVDCAVGFKPRDERRARLRIDESIDVERPHVGLGGFAGVTEDQLQVGVGGESGRGIRTDGADVDAFVHSLEQPREGGPASFHGSRL